MNTYHYKHFSLWERQKLESLIGSNVAKSEQFLTKIYNW